MIKVGHTQMLERLGEPQFNEKHKCQFYLKEHSLIK
jgi:hypothetical protein